MAPAPFPLQWSCCAHGRVDGEVAHLFFGLGTHVAAAAVGSLAGCALAALLAHAPLTRQVDAPQVESLERVRRGFVAARTAGRHPGVGAGGLLAGFRRAGGLFGRGLGRRLAFGRLRIPRLGLSRLRAFLLLAVLRRRGFVLVAAQGLACPVRQGERGGVVDVFPAGRAVAPVGGQRPSCVVDDHVGPVTEHLSLDADRGDEPRMAGGQPYVPHPSDRLGQRLDALLLEVPEVLSIARRTTMTDYLRHLTPCPLVRGEQMLIDVATMARELSVSAETVRRWIRRGDIPIVRAGRRVLIRREALREFVDRLDANVPVTDGQ